MTEQEAQAMDQLMAAGAAGVVDVTVTPVPVTCPPSAVHDQEMPWRDVGEGDLVLWGGEFRLVEAITDCWPVVRVRLDGDLAAVVNPGTRTTVRRYDTGED